MAVRSDEVVKGKKRKGATMAEQADRHELYEMAVQDVEEECNFIIETYETMRGRKPLSFREDFCGTASAACEWVRRGPRQSFFPPRRSSASQTGRAGPPAASSWMPISRPGSSSSSLM